MPFDLRLNYHDHLVKILAGIIVSIKQSCNASSFNESERKFASYPDGVFASVNSTSSIKSHRKVDKIQFAHENAVKQIENDPGRNVGSRFLATRRSTRSKTNTNS